MYLAISSVQIKQENSWMVFPKAWTLNSRLKSFQGWGGVKRTECQILIRSQLQGTKGGRASLSNTIFCMKAAPGLHQAGIAWAQGSVGAQCCRMHRARGPSYPPCLCSSHQKQLHFTLQPTQKWAGTSRGVFQRRRAVHTQNTKAGLWERWVGLHTDTTCMQRHCSSTVTSLHQLYKYQEYFPQLFKSLRHMCCARRISSGLSGMGLPMSNSKTKLSFQYFPPCPILLTSANTRTHGATVTFARHSFRDLHLR